MIVTEDMYIHGRRLVKTYSDIGMMVERDGILYDVAIDPVDSGRTYMESTTPVFEEETQ